MDDGQVFSVSFIPLQLFNDSQSSLINDVNGSKSLMSPEILSILEILEW